MNTDARDEDAKFVVEKMGLTYATLKATGLPERYNVRSFPTLVVIDREGVVRDVHVGYSPTLGDEVVKSVERLLKARPWGTRPAPDPGGDHREEEPTPLGVRRSGPNPS